MKVIAQLEFELTYYNIAAQLFNHNTTNGVVVKVLNFSQSITFKFGLIPLRKWQPPLSPLSMGYILPLMFLYNDGFVIKKPTESDRTLTKDIDNEDH